MNRLHKKCAIASTGLHLLLILVLFVGPGFLAPKTKAPDMPLLNFVPFETVDDLVSGGGNPNAHSPPAQPNARPEAVEPAPPPPAPEAKPEPKVKEPDPEPEVKNTEAAMEPAPAPKKKKPEISLKPVVRNTGESKKKAADQPASRQEKEYADYRNRLSRALGSTAGGIPGSISKGAEPGLPGPGGGGVPYANFLQAVKTVYTRAWELPEGVTDDDATVETEIRIARDGDVISAKITRRSGNSAVDESVRATLQRVRYAAPLPKTAKEDERTVTISFNVRAKKAYG
jgi:TonB family protein